MRKVPGLLLSFSPIYLALLFGALVVLLTGGNPIETYFYLGREAFGSLDAVRATMVSSTVLLFTSTATAIGFRAGVFTLAAEGAFVAGGLSAAVFGSQVLTLPPALGIPIIFLTSAIVGAVVALIPALLRAYLQVDEVVSTLMFNFVTIGIVTWLVQRFFIAPKQANSATRFIQPKYQLPDDIFGTGFSLGFFLGVGVVVLFALFVSHTAMGFDFKSLSYSPKFAKVIGINTSSVVLTSMLLVGAVAGLGGSIHLTGLVHRYVPGFSAGFGFTGLAIALLAKLRPAGLVVGSILFGALNSAGSTAQLFTKIPLDIVNVLQGFLMIAAVIEARPLFKRRSSERKVAVR